MHSADSFNPSNVESMLPASPMEIVDLYQVASVNDRGSKVRIPTDPISSPESTQPSTNI